MANPEHEEILKQGVEVWNEWRRTSLVLNPDLSGAYLAGINMQGMNLKGVQFIASVLFNADLRGSDLSLADESDLLSGCDLTWANLTHSLLDNANFEWAKLQDTVFAKTSLDNVKGLDKCVHSSGSIIDATTLANSPNLPLEFYRGIGLKNWEVEQTKLYDPALSPTEIAEIVTEIHRLRADNPIQIHNLFISYNYNDASFINFIETHLSKRNILYWRDKHDATAGRLERIVIRAMKNRTVLLVLSENSVNSDWVEFEVRRAREIEMQTGRDVICPVALDDSWKTCNWSGVLRDQIEKYNILDFSNWRDKEQFTGMFERLVSGLDLFYRAQG